MPYDGLLKQNPIVDHSLDRVRLRLVRPPVLFQGISCVVFEEFFWNEIITERKLCQDHRGSQKIFIRHEILDREISRVYSFEGPHVNIWERDRQFIQGSARIEEPDRLFDKQADVAMRDER